MATAADERHVVERDQPPPASLQRWQRADGPFSPVENCLPPAYRVGYEEYTADAHYANLALGFLAAAVLRGFTGADDETRPQERSLVRAEGAPTHRALVHGGAVSVHVNAAPHPPTTASASPT